MTEPEQAYRSFLLRLWRRGTGRASAWQAMIETPASGERRAFATLESLFDFLREQAGGGGAPPES